MIDLVYAAGAYLDAVRQVTEEKKYTQIDQATHFGGKQTQERKCH